MIAVISDSHIPTRADKIPDGFQKILKDADLIVHCGDFETEEIYQEIDSLGELVGVKGNCDRFEIQNSATFERVGKSFGVYHGTGINPRGHLPTLVDIADKLEVGILLTGHTHQQRALKEEGKIILNPGSCTGVGGATAEDGNPEMMVLELEGNELKVELITLSEHENLSYEEKRFKV